MESRASRRRTSSETGIVGCTWEARSSASAARCNHLGSGDDDVTHCLIRLTSAAASAPGLGPVRLPDRKQDSAHDVLGYAAVAKLIQLKGVLSSVGSLLGQV